MTTIAILCAMHITGAMNCIEFPTMQACVEAEQLLYRPVVARSECSEMESVLTAAPYESPIPEERK